ncbi:MAG: hypothetical protein E7K14_04915 [Bacillota bacterium]|nr:hypothetical protein [Bacillota bacterium]
MSFKLCYFFQNGCQAAQIRRLCGGKGLAFGNGGVFGTRLAASLGLGGFHPAGDSDRADAELCSGFLLGASFILRFPFGDKIKNGLCWNIALLLTLIFGNKLAGEAAKTTDTRLK